MWAAISLKKVLTQEFTQPIRTPEQSSFIGGNVSLKDFVKVANFKLFS